MSSNKNKWTTFEVMRGKPIQTLIWSVIIVTIFKIGIIVYSDNPALTLIEAANLRAIGLSPILYILAIPVFPIVAFLLRGYYSRKLPKQTQYKEVNQTVNNTGFKWNMIYSLIIGYIMYFVCGGVLRLLIDMIEEQVPEGITSGDNPFALLLLIAGEMAVYIIMIVFVIKFVKSFHKKMIKKTGTNQALIMGLRQGYYWEQLYPMYRNNGDVERIIRILESGCATSIKGACSKYTSIKNMKKTAMGVGIIGGIITAIIAVLTCGLGNMATKEFNATLTEGESYDEYMTKKKNNEALREAERQEKKLKNNQQAQLNQKEKEMYAAKKRYVDQANYNTRTHYTAERRGEYKKAVNEYNRMKKNM